MSIENRTTIIGNKTVFLSEPYEQKSENFSDFIGNQTEIQMIVAAWTRVANSDPFSPILVGEPGVGKTALIVEISRILNKPLYIFQGHDDLTAFDLTVELEFSNSDKSKFDYTLSPLASAMVTGGICLFDEIGKVPPKALSLLTSVLDNRTYLETRLLSKKRIFAHPNFRFAATTNSGEQNYLPEFLQSRLKPVLEIKLPTKQQIEHIILDHFQKINFEVTKLIALFWILYYENSKNNVMPSVRDIIYCFEYAIKLNATNAKKTKALETSFNGISESSLKLAFENIFGKK